MNGLFIAAGPAIDRKGYLDNRIILLDIVPTILHLCGLPIPKDMDGRVLTQLKRLLLMNL